MLQTMELILGLQPMTQFEAASIPMINSFTDRPDFTPYSMEQTKYWTEENGTPAQQPAATNSTASSTSQYPADLDFSKPDAVDREKLNQENWKKIKGYYPEPNHK